MAEEIVQPRKEKRDPDIGPVSLMVAMERDVALIRRLMGAKGRSACRIFTSKLYKDKYYEHDLSLVGPLLGAPHAVMILEKLKILGARSVLFLGWCGSLQRKVRIGDLVVPDEGIIGEGTSAYYAVDEENPKPSNRVVAAIEESLTTRSVPFEKGPVWSTDAPYRETRETVLSLQKKGVLGVDMELSALLTAARFREVELAALLVVSDELGTLDWRTGFSSDHFGKSRRMAAEVLCETCLKLYES